MPEMDGFSLINHIKEKHHNIEIMVMTAFPELSIIDKLESAGVHYYIFKPFHIKQLVLIQLIYNNHEF